MGDRYTLADLMRDRDANAGHGMDSLVDSVPEPGPATASSNLRDFHAWLTRNVLAPAQYGMFYPPRVLSRYMNPDRANPFWTESIPGLPRATEKDWQILGQTFDTVGPMGGGYQPGSRLSDQVEDRRPRSIWEY